MHWPAACLNKHTTHVLVLAPITDLTGVTFILRFTNYRYLVLMSEGITKCMASEEVVQFVHVHASAKRADVQRVREVDKLIAGAGGVHAGLSSGGDLRCGPEKHCQW